MLVESNSNQLPFLGTMRGEQKLDERGYRRVYKSFGGSNDVRKEFATMGNSQGAVGFKTQGEDYNRHRDRFFLIVNTLKETKEIEMNSFGYALTQSKPKLEGETAHQWEILVHSADATNIQAIASTFFEQVMDAPQDGDLALYNTSKATTTVSGIKIGAHEITHAGVYRNSQALKGTIQSKWDFVKNPYIFEHDVFAVPGYLGTEVTFFRPKTQIHAQALSSIVEQPHEQKDEGSQTIKILKGTAALVLQASYDSEGKFHPSQGLYKRGMIQLKKAGCSTSTQKIETPEDFRSCISSAADASISFLSLRGHGAQKSVQISSSYVLWADEVQDVFQELPKKLTSNAVIYLDACSNGSLNGNFYNNMQFAFAKLTAQMPDVTIVAPSRDSFMNLIEWRDLQGFHFEAIHSPEDSKEDDITIVLGKETKELIRNVQTEELDQIKEALLKSLKRSASDGSLGRLYLDIKSSNENVDKGLLISITNNISADGKGLLKDLEEIQKKVRFFVEELGADGSDSRGYIPYIHYANPLFAAIHIGSGELVAYLLKHNAADPSHSFRGISPKDYAEQQHQHEIARLL